MKRPDRARSIRGQATRFALLSGLSFAGYLGLTAMLHELLGVSSYAAVPIAMACVTVLNFVTLRCFIFEPTGRGWRSEMLGFLGSIAGFRVAEYAAFLLLHGVCALAYLPAYSVILAVSAVCKFLFLRNILFAAAAPRPATPLAKATS